jgi:hypothetical protein
MTDPSLKLKSNITAVINNALLRSIQFLLDYVMPSK